MNRLFWIAAAAMVAISVHIAFVLIVPPLALRQSVARVSGTAQANAFFILPSDEQGKLFPAYPKFSVVGICAFDVSKSKVSLSANLLPGFWTLTIYASSGDVIYALNDSQSGTGSFTVSLSRAPGLLEMLTERVTEDPQNTTGWTVSATDPKGFAVLWQPVADRARRAGVVRAFEKSSCAATS